MKAIWREMKRKSNRIQLIVPEEHNMGDGAAVEKTQNMERNDNIHRWPVLFRLGIHLSVTANAACLFNSDLSVSLKPNWMHVQMKDPPAVKMKKEMLQQIYKNATNNTKLYDL